MKMKRYKFQALVTLGAAREDALAAINSGQMRRVVVRGHHHDTGSSKFFSALVTKQGGEQPWPEQDPVIMTVALMADDPGEYFEIGDSFAFWLGHDLGRGVVTRRLFV
jgi:beta-phosphoglucomutase-like phosphatase (HAD superfamily)